MFALWDLDPGYEGAFRPLRFSTVLFAGVFEREAASRRGARRLMLFGCFFGEQVTSVMYSPVGVAEEQDDGADHKEADQR
jgi:hypothetical protein